MNIDNKSTEIFCKDFFYATYLTTFEVYQLSVIVNFDIADTWLAQKRINDYKAMQN